MSSDFEEALRRLWRTARFRVEQLGKSPDSLNETCGALRALEYLAKDCGIELEPKKCALCGHEEGSSPGKHLCGIAGYKQSVCYDADGCRARLLDKLNEQLKDGAR